MNNRPDPLAGAPRTTDGVAPVRRPGSIRRTMTLDTPWPEGYGHPRFIQGRARDIYTPADDSAPRVVAESSITATVSVQREILAIAATPAQGMLDELVGCRAGGHLRGELARVVPQDLHDGTPLYLLLDDLSGATLVSSWAWSRWVKDKEAFFAPGGPSVTASRGGAMENICMGFATGSPALDKDGKPLRVIQDTTSVPEIANPADPQGWHALPVIGHEVSARRSRRIDLWMEADGLIHIDAGFQDSATVPEGGRQAIHEYRIFAAVSPEDFRLHNIDVRPLTLPYGQCPTAAPTAQKLVGLPIGDSRRLVLEFFKGPAGCTHLNDMLRALGETPQLSAALRAAA